MPIEEDTFDIAHIAGNASDEIKQTVGNPGGFFAHRRPHEITSPIFGESIQKHLKVTEISIKKKEEEERKLEARMVFEIDVTEGLWEFIDSYLKSLLTDLDMLNAGGNVHGGCSAFLVDLWVH